MVRKHAHSKNVLKFRTGTFTKSAYHTSVRYFVAKIKAYRIVLTYHTVPYCIAWRKMYSWLCTTVSALIVILSFLSQLAFHYLIWLLEHLVKCLERFLAAAY